MPTIIDGYNLIFTCGLEGKTRTPQSLEKARARLISTVASMSSDSERSNTTIVFDAKRLPIRESSADSTVNGIRILYAVDHDDADTLIEELIAAHSTPKKLTVVSSDHRIQTAASRRKATATDSDRWWDQLLENRHDQKAKPSHHKTLEQNPNLASDGEKRQAIASLESFDWNSIFEQTKAPAVPSPPDASSAGKVKNENEPDDPFPEGYADDLLDDEPD
jgi:predicted RNA-binding protein with PIN domain